MSIAFLNSEQYPYICAPITGRTNDEIMTQLQTMVEKKPDLLEWRVDFYEQISQFEKVHDMLKEIDENRNGIPLLFTIRSQKEGGEVIPLDEEGVTNLVASICESEFVDFIDFELHSEQKHVETVRDMSKRYGKKLILSYHNFTETPSKQYLMETLQKMEAIGADVAKIAVMPKTKEDVFTLLHVTEEAKKLLSIPIITISMADLGMMSRVIGWYYGSCITFAVGDKSSAPGQVPIEQLRTLIEQMKQLTSK